MEFLSSSFEYNVEWGTRSPFCDVVSQETNLKHQQRMVYLKIFVGNSNSVKITNDLKTCVILTK